MKKEIAEIRAVIEARMQDVAATSWEHWYMSRTLLDFQHKGEDDRYKLMVVMAWSIWYAEGNIRWAEYNAPGEVAACRQQRVFFCDIFELLVAPHPLEVMDPLDGQTRPLFLIVLRLTNHYWFGQQKVAA